MHLHIQCTFVSVDSPKALHTHVSASHDDLHLPYSTINIIIIVTCQNSNGGRLW